MADDSELYDWRDRSDIKMIPLANASSLRWCSENKGEYVGEKYERKCKCLGFHLFYTRKALLYAHSYVAFKI